MSSLESVERALQNCQLQMVEDLAFLGLVLENPKSDGVIDPTGELMGCFELSVNIPCPSNRASQTG